MDYPMYPITCFQRENEKIEKLIFFQNLICLYFPVEIFIIRSKEKFLFKNFVNDLLLSDDFG